MASTTEKWERLRKRAVMELKDAAVGIAVFQGEPELFDKRVSAIMETLPKTTPQHIVSWLKGYTTALREGLEAAHKN
jgi:hypothetical protein